jgi:glucokinase
LILACGSAAGWWIVLVCEGGVISLEPTDAKERMIEDLKAGRVAAKRRDEEDRTAAIVGNV